MARYTVFGNPISHSVSPYIHQAFADEFGLLLDYQRSLSSIGVFAAQVARFFRTGGAGANVTLPFKVAAFELVTHVTERAQRAGAVNTLIPLGAGQLLGDNTDGAGLLRDLHRQFGDLTNQRIVIIGAGGAVRGALASLLQQPVQQIVIANRTLSNAAQLVAEFADARLSYCALDAIPPHDGLINAASVAYISDGQLPIQADALTETQFVYDMSYAAKPTAFLQWVNAQQPQLMACDGLGMLVEQAALSFALWHDGLYPKTAPVIAAVRAQLVANDEA